MARIGTRGQWGLQERGSEYWKCAVDRGAGMCRSYGGAGRTGELDCSLIPEDFICGSKKIFICLLGQQVAVHLLLHWIPVGLLREMRQSLRANCASAFFSPVQETVIKLGGSLVEHSGEGEETKNWGGGELAVVGAGHTRGAQGLSSGRARGRWG